MSVVSPIAEDIACPSKGDAGFVLQIFDKEVENVLKIARSPGHPSQHLVPAEPFFRCKQHTSYIQWKPS